MGDKSKIEWLDKGASWNVVTGCEQTSNGCRSCYAKLMSKRLKAMGVKKYKEGFDKVVCHFDRDLLSQPKRWKRSRRIFLNSMSDTFNPHVSYDYIKNIYGIMVEANHHTYQILTKRHARMYNVVTMLHNEGFLTEENSAHIHHGVTVEEMKYIHRIDFLRRTPSKVRFVSFEPLLGPVVTSRKKDLLQGIDQAIIGGESGPGARRMMIAWVGDIVNQARLNGCAIFMKQMGAVMAKELRYKTRKGNDPEEWPIEYRIRELV